MVSPLVDAGAFGLTEGASCSRTASWLLSDPEAESLTFHTTLQGWALAPGAWETREDSYCSSPSDTFQRLAFWPVVGAAAFATGPNGTIRVLRTGHITGHVRLSSRGSTRTASSSRYHGFNRLLIAGWSTLRSDASLPFRYRGCRGETGACGACMDGFDAADCECQAGATELTLSRPVEAGQLLQVAAIPAHWDDAQGMAGDLSLRFAPGGSGVCDYAAAPPLAPECAAAGGDSRWGRGWCAGWCAAALCGAPRPSWWCTPPLPS